MNTSSFLGKAGVSRVLGALGGLMLLSGLAALAGGAEATTRPPNTAGNPLAAAGTRLAFANQPGGGPEGQAWASQPVVTVRDAAGNQDTQDNATVISIAITQGTGAPGAVLACDNDEDPATAGIQVMVAFGTAPFFGCRIDKANDSGSPYTLTATASRLSSAVSSSFSITRAPTPTATLTPTPTPTPVPTETPAPPPPPVTREVGEAGGEVRVGGGVSEDGGVTVNVPPERFSSTVAMTVSVENRAPEATVSGADLLPKTIEVSIGTEASLRGTVEIQVNLTRAELGGRDIQTIRGGVVQGTAVEPRPTRVLDAAAGTLGVTADHFSKFTLFAITSAGPDLTAPGSGDTLSSFGATLSWAPPPGALQFQLQVAPFNNDGPGVNLVRNVASSFTLPAPPQWYGLLPDTTYFWRVRTTAVAVPAEKDWSAWSSRTFRTPQASSAGITPVTPAPGATVEGATPALTWADSSAGLFYYEVQVSKDASFNTDPATAVTMVYWVLIHGGVGEPRNTYRIPAQFPLEAGTAYHWRVRPRVQGDGRSVAWSAAWSFNAP